MEEGTNNSSSIDWYFRIFDNDVEALNEDYAALQASLQAAPANDQLILVRLWHQIVGVMLLGP